MSKYGNGFGLSYWEGALSACQEEAHKLENAVGMEPDKSPMSGRVRQFEKLLERAKEQEQRIRELEAALRMVLDDPDSLSGRPRTLEVVMEALGQT